MIFKIGYKNSILSFIFICFISLSCSKNIEVFDSNEIRIIQSLKELKQSTDKNKPYSVVNSTECIKTAFTQAKVWHPEPELIYVDGGLLVIPQSGKIGRVNWLFVFKNNLRTECLFMVVNNDTILDVARKRSAGYKWIGVKKFKYGIEKVIKKHTNLRVKFLIGLFFEGENEPFWVCNRGINETVFVNANTLELIENSSLYKNDWAPL